MKKFIRLGTCGGISKDLKLNDIVIPMGASTDSKVNRIRFKGNDFASLADYEAKTFKNIYKFHQYFFYSAHVKYDWNS